VQVLLHLPCMGKSWPMVCFNILMRCTVKPSEFHFHCTLYSSSKPNYPAPSLLDFTVHQILSRFTSISSPVNTILPMSSVTILLPLLLPGSSIAPSKSRQSVASRFQSIDSHGRPAPYTVERPANANCPFRPSERPYWTTTFMQILLGYSFTNVDNDSAWRPKPDSSEILKGPL